MNIYLDIDGVLLANEMHAAVGADEFLQAILDKHPENAYWLTTHCWRGENRCVELLTPVLQPETVALLQKIKPTEWGELKTDAIDFSQPFLWFDDDLLQEEAKVLEEHKASGNYVPVNLQAYPKQLIDLTDKFFK
jgi:hypothetical protein